jgi:hypothetical protein
MEKTKIRIITEVEIEYNPDLVSIDNIVSDLDYSFKIGDIHADIATVTKTEITDFH